MTTEHQQVESHDDPPHGSRMVVNLSPGQAIIAGAIALVVLTVVGFLLSGIVLIVLAVGLVLWGVGLVLRLFGLTGRANRPHSENQVTIIPPSTPAESIDQEKTQAATDLQAEFRRRLQKNEENTRK